MNIGLLCWTPMPPVNLRPLARLRSLAFEAVFLDYLLCWPGVTQFEVATNSPLEKGIHNMAWLHLCTHPSLTEVPNNLTKTEAQRLEI